MIDATEAVTAKVCQQAVILVGGRGTRLGDLTRNRPKPLMLISEDVMFLDLLIEEVSRQGFTNILLLAGYLSSQLVDRYHGRQKKVNIEVVTEPSPMGTGGALVSCRSLLDNQFLLLNGDTWFDFNWRALEKELCESRDAQAVVALLPAPTERRYGTAILQGNHIQLFAEKETDEYNSTSEVSGHFINGGAYLCRRSMLEGMADKPFSLEEVLLPKLAKAGQLLGVVGNGYFIDIGLPETLEHCRSSYPDFLKRPALFLDRDGTLNHDAGYTHKVEDCDLIEGAAKLVRHFCDEGWHVFVVTNQAGIGKGLYDEAAMRAFNDRLNQVLIAEGGGMVHDFAYCPYTKEANLDHYKVDDHPERKPNPGMIWSLERRWHTDMTRSFLIGDNDKDIEAARRAGIEGFHFLGGDLWAFASKTGLVERGGSCLYREHL